MNKKLKISLISVASILGLLMALVCLWWILIATLGPDKYISNTFNVAWQTTADGSNTQPIMKVKYMSNRNGNGYEMLDIQWNYFSDEDKDMIYSQGLQYVAKHKNGKIEFEYLEDLSVPRERNKEKDKKILWVKQEFYDYWGGMRAKETSTEFYNYASFNDYQTTTGSVNPLGIDSRLKIEIGNENEKELYRLAVKGANTPKTMFKYQRYIDNEFLKREEYGNFYCYYDFNFLSELILNQVRGVKGGTKQNIIWEFGDYFDYYKGDQLITSNEEQAKVIKEITSYYSIMIEVSDDGAQTYNDSLFKMVKGSGTFNTNPGPVTDDYFIGRSIINCSVYDFDLVKVHENNVALKLKDSFVDYYKKYKNTIELNIVIDLDKITELGYTYFGLADDHGLNDFAIYKIVTKQTVNGQIVIDEVTL